MLDEYPDGLYEDELDLRKEHLQVFNYSLIAEGHYDELDNLEKWMLGNGVDVIHSVYYSKIGYDFHFREYFMDDLQFLEKLKDAVPRIFTRYEKAYPKPLICRSIGYGKDETYDPSNAAAILLDE